MKRISVLMLVMFITLTVLYSPAGAGKKEETSSTWEYAQIIDRVLAEFTPRYECECAAVYFEAYYRSCKSERQLGWNIFKAPPGFMLIWACHYFIKDLKQSDKKTAED